MMMRLPFGIQLAEPREEKIAKQRLVHSGVVAAAKVQDDVRNISRPFE